MRYHALCVIPMLAAACGPGIELPVGEAVSDLCQTSKCGTNGTVVGGIYFSRLWLPPLPFAASLKTNDEGFRIVHYYASKDDWPLFPSDNQLDVTIGKFASPGVTAFLELVFVGTGRHYLVEISEIQHDQEYWTKPSPDTRNLETYQLRYTVPERCSHNASGGTTCTKYWPMCQQLEGIDGDPEIYAVVFEGEIYDHAPTYTVQDTSMVGPGTWFNIACMGSIPAKMHLIRRTRAAAMDPGDPVPPTPVPERQAFLNMWSASYCGDGVSFTENLHPLRIRDTTNSLRTDWPIGFVDDDEHIKSIEAVWGPDGALCLNEPRFAPYDEVIDHCNNVRHELPPCPATVLDSWTSMPGAVVLSANPDDPWP